jgi:hypothetical protein
MHVSLKAKRVLIMSLMICGLAVLYFANPTTNSLAPKCPFKLLTGFSCPGCGIQRALHALLHGRIIEAAKYNLYLVYAGPYAMSFLVKDFFLTGKTQERVARWIENKYVVKFYIYTFVLWMIIRNILTI